MPSTERAEGPTDRQSDGPTDRTKTHREFHSHMWVTIVREDSIVAYLRFRSIVTGQPDQLQQLQVELQSHPLAISLAHSGDD